MSASRSTSRRCSSGARRWRSTWRRRLPPPALPAQRLELEITEAVLIRDDEAALAVLHQLRELGVRIALDDFGTGYSSLSYLQRFPFDKIKIDRSFIKDIGRRGRVLVAIIQAVVNIAAASNMTTTAEGVEHRAAAESAATARLHRDAGLSVQPGGFGRRGRGCCRTRDKAARGVDCVNPRIRSQARACSRHRPLQLTRSRRTIIFQLISPPGIASPANKKQGRVERDEPRHRILSEIARPSALAPFRIRNYRFQWPADLLTSWAFEMETLILGWYVLVETGSVLLLTVFASLGYVGTLIAPMFGVVGDRIGHRDLLAMMRATYAVLAATLMTLALTGYLDAALCLHRRG